LGFVGLRLDADASIMAAVAALAALAPQQHEVLVLCQRNMAYGRKEFQIDTFRRIIDVNLNSLMACAEKFREALVHSKGSLITISSVGGWRATIGNPAYAASKAGAIHLTATLGKAWASKGIRVNGVAPGLVDTPARHSGLRGSAAPGKASSVQACVNSMGLAEAESVLRQCAGSGAAQRAADSRRPRRSPVGHFKFNREIGGGKRSLWAFKNAYSRACACSSGRRMRPSTASGPAVSGSTNSCMKPTLPAAVPF